MNKPYIQIFFTKNIMKSIKGVDGFGVLIHKKDLGRWSKDNKVFENNLNSIVRFGLRNFEELPTK